MGMHDAEAFRAEVERLKPLILGGDPFMTDMPAALAQARGEVIVMLLKRPAPSPFTVEDMDWLLASARSAANSQTAAQDDRARASELVRKLAAHRAVLAGEGGPRRGTTMRHDGYEILVVPYRNFDGRPSGGPWLIRCYDGAGQHVHSAEGGASLAGGLREVERAIQRDQDARRLVDATRGLLDPVAVVALLSPDTDAREPKHKHDADCRRRKRTQPLLCTCDCSDEEVAVAQAQRAAPEPSPDTDGGA